MGLAHPHPSSRIPVRFPLRDGGCQGLQGPRCASDDAVLVPRELTGGRGLQPEVDIVPLTTVGPGSLGFLLSLEF